MKKLYGLMFVVMFGNIVCFPSISNAVSSIPTPVKALIVATSAAAGIFSCETYDDAEKNTALLLQKITGYFPYKNSSDAPVKLSKNGEKLFHYLVKINQIGSAFLGAAAVGMVTTSACLLIQFFKNTQLPS